MRRNTLIFMVFLLASTWVYSQKKPTQNGIMVPDTISVKVNPLGPAKAAFYSAIVPGLGQFYNKKYWKIPLVYAALGTTIYYYLQNDRKYNEFRDVYKRRLEGFTDDQYSYLQNDRLIQAQRFYQSNRDLSTLLTAAFYLLNIVDANVDAHLMQFNVNDKLTFRPNLYRDDLSRRQQLGMAVVLNF